MGIEAAVGAGIAGGLGLLGYRQQKKAFKAAQQSANQQLAAVNEQSNVMRAEQAKLSGSTARAKEKTALGVSRANRGRIRGGIFGDSEGVNRPLTGRLG